jgi:hypothetical protein
VGIIPRHRVNGEGAKYPPYRVDNGGNLPHYRHMASLLDDIGAFIEAHGLSESQFGVLAVNDKNLVPDLRGGRDIRMSTLETIRRFMMTYRPEAQADAA